MLATPTYDGTLTIPYVQSQRALERRLAAADVQLDIRYIAAATIAVARNAFASMLLNDSSFSSLLFVDADMGFRPELVLRMLALEQDFVGCIYPTRMLDVAAIQAAARRFPDSNDVARLVAAEYIGERTLVLESDKLNVRSGFVRTTGIGAGILLLRRAVIETLADRCPDVVVQSTFNPYLGLGIRGRVIQCFEGYRLPDGSYLSEDLSFCRRWTDCGGEIWACVDEPVQHVGTAINHGNFLEKLKHNYPAVR